MTVDNDDRIIIEDIIFDIQESTEKYLDSQKALHEKMLVASVQEGIEILNTIKDSFEDDDMKESYRMNLFVPLQLAKLIEIRKEKKND